MVDGLSSELKQDLIPVYKHLTTQLDTDSGDTLMRQLAEAEALVARVSILKRNASQTLSEVREQHLPEKSKDHTELDRKTKLEALTAPQTYVEGVLSDLEKKLYNRISLGQTMLKSMQEEMKRGLN